MILTFELGPEGVMAPVVQRMFLDGSHGFMHSKTRRAMRLVYGWGRGAQTATQRGRGLLGRLRTLFEVQ